MALRSPTEFHNDWGIFAPGINPDDNLPNRPTALTQSNTLQIGDTATVSTTPPTKWYCVDASFGAAIWVQFAPGGGGGTDIYPYRIIVGCGVAPYSDTLAVCNILDPGDGSGVAAALALANAFAPYTNGIGLESRVEVFVRAGIYDLNQPGSPVAPYYAAPGVSFYGASISSTTFVGRNQNDMGFLIKEGFGEVSDFQVDISALTGASSGSTAVITAQGTAAQPDFGSLVFRNVVVAQLGTMLDRATSTLRAAFDIVNLSGQDAALLGLRLEDCGFILRGDTSTPAAGPSDYFCAIRSLQNIAPTENTAFFYASRLTVSSSEMGCYLEDIAVKASFCFITGEDTSFFGVSIGAFSSLTDCFLVSGTSNPLGPLGVVVDLQGAAADFLRLSVTHCQLLGFGGGGNGVGIQLLDMQNAQIDHNTLYGFFTGIDCANPPCVDNVVAFNNAKTSAVPYNVNALTNEFVHNIL